MTAHAGWFPAASEEGGRWGEPGEGTGWRGVGLGMAGDMKGVDKEGKEGAEGGGGGSGGVGGRVKAG